MDDVKNVIDRGIDALNDYWGSASWVDVVDLYVLDMREPDRCVLGQVFGGFIRGYSALGLDSGKVAVSYGFESSQHSDDGEYDFTYDDLQTEWMDRLREMKSA